MCILPDKINLFFFKEEKKEVTNISANIVKALLALYKSYPRYLLIIILGEV